MKEELKDTTVPAVMDKDMSRRRFLGFAGITGAGLFIASCNDDDDPQPADNDGINLGSADAGLLNYALALKQLTAAFYVKASSPLPGGMTELEGEMLMQIRDHELAHREFFRALLQDKAIGDLEFDFDSVDFGDRSSVLDKAKEFENLSIGAFLGMTKLFVTPDYTVSAMKIASVEGRHAAYVGHTRTPGFFVEPGDGGVLDEVRTPKETLSMIDKYLKTKVSGEDLPN